MKSRTLHFFSIVFHAFAYSSSSFSLPWLPICATYSRTEIELIFSYNFILWNAFTSNIPHRYYSNFTFRTEKFFSRLKYLLLFLSFSRLSANITTNVSIFLKFVNYLPLKYWTTQLVISHPSNSIYTVIMITSYLYI